MPCSIAGARPLQHRQHAIAAERFEEVVERADLERGHGVSVIRRREDNVRPAGDLLGDGDPRRAGHPDVEKRRSGRSASTIPIAESPSPVSCTSPIQPAQPM